MNPADASARRVPEGGQQPGATRVRWLRGGQCWGRRRLRRRKHPLHPEGLRTDAGSRGRTGRGRPPRRGRRGARQGRWPAGRGRGRVAAKAPQSSGRAASAADRPLGHLVLLGALRAGNQEAPTPVLALPPPPEIPLLWDLLEEEEACPLAWRGRCPSAGKHDCDRQERGRMALEPRPGADVDSRPPKPQSPGCSSPSPRES